MRTFVIGDIHGVQTALLQVLDRAGFRRDRDRLISLGDVTDTGPHSAEAVETLLGLANHVAITGNHDIWAREYLEEGSTPDIWLVQGGDKTVESYIRSGYRDDPRHLAFFRQQRPYFIDEENRLYVHGGFHPEKSMETQETRDLCWDRSLWRQAVQSQDMGFGFPENQYRHVFIGHTPTIPHFGHARPVTIGNITNLDTGAKGRGRLTIMDADTMEFWQSDPVATLRE